MHSLRLLLALATLLPAAAAAQDLHPSRRPSPMGMARVTLADGTYVRIVYSQPYKRDRNNIFGAADTKPVVPFGERWRLGANEATEITVTKDVMVLGKKLAAGTYSMFATPGADTWKLHFNSTLGLSGTGYFVDGKFTPVELGPTDVLVVEARPVVIPSDKEEVDQMTFSFEKTTSGAGADMVLRWIRTEVRVPIAAGK
jgi:hypothetical protein